MVRAIHDDNSQAARPGNEFTPSSATKMLPLVRRIVTDIIRLSRSIEIQREQIQGIDDLPEPIDQADYKDELSDVRRSLAQDQEKFDACIDELLSLGLEAHEPFDGSVDFPAVLDRRNVRLCWRPEDDRVEYWHEVGQSNDQRKKIDPKTFGAESLN